MCGWLITFKGFIHQRFDPVSESLSAVRLTPYQERSSF
jgi:hypothetical protein